MDHPTGNVIRPEPRSAQPQHHYQPSVQQQPSGSGMAGIVVDRELLLEDHIYRTSRTNSTHSLAPSPETITVPDSPPTESYGEIGGNKAFGRKRSRKRPKTCGVCGDRAKSFHFGGLSCDSCKAFFRRSVQNDAHVAFRCAYDSCCDINISTRKSCQFCRFKKCLSIGMEKSWVMTEDERNALNQQRLEKKHCKPATVVQPQETAKATEPTFTFQGSNSVVVSEEPAALALQESEYVADVEKMLDYMAYEEQLEIKSIVETYLHAYKEMPFRVSLEEGRRDTLEIIEMFTTILRRFAYFSKLIPDFSELSKGDQANLLRAAVLEMCLLRGAVCFDTETNRWPNSTMESLKDCPQLRVEDMQRLVSRELFEMHITFIFHMKRLRIDEPTAMLLIMTVLFSPERIPVENKVKINQSQEKYLMLLKNYVTWKFGPAAGSRVYPQLLTKLSDLRQLNDFHTEFHLNLDQKEVNAIKKSMMELHLNPYPNWKIVPESQQSSPEESRPTSPILPVPSPRVVGGPFMPVVTQALIQSFADRRIPTLLENPYATFETDLGMIRQVQQTLGSLFPSAALSSVFTQGSPSLYQGQPSSNSEASKTLLHERIVSPTATSPDNSISPRGFSSSTESAEAQALEILQSSHSQEYQAPSLRDISSATHSNDPMLTAEYHSERLQQFLQQHNRSIESETESVIRGHSSTSTVVSSLGSQTVLRKHTSGSSLPGAPSSVIRSAHIRSSEEPTVARTDPQSFRSINCNTVSGAGWGGGEVHTTSNGYRQPSDTSSVPVTTATITQPSSYDDESCYRRSP